MGYVDQTYDMQVRNMVFKSDIWYLGNKYDI